MKAQPNEYGVTWATSRNEKLSIALGGPCPRVNRDGWKVWAIYMGTHDLAPVTRNFGNDEAAARRYANELWSRR